MDPVKLTACKRRSLKINDLPRTLCYVELHYCTSTELRSSYDCARTLVTLIESKAARGLMTVLIELQNLHMEQFHDHYPSSCLEIEVFSIIQPTTSN